MAMTAKDFDIRFSAYDSSQSVATNIANNASGTSYYPQWTQCEVRQKMSDITTFNSSLSGVVCTSLPVNVNNVMGLYYYDGSSTTLSFVGMVNSVTYQNYNVLSVEGMDFSYLLSKYTLNPAKDSDSYSTPISGLNSGGGAFSLANLINVINSPNDNDDMGAAAILPIGTIDTVYIDKPIKIPAMNKQQALFYVAQQFTGLYFYIDELTGAINAKSTRGTSSVVKDYYLTGASTNAYLGSRSFSGFNIMNSITVIGQKGINLSTYSDYTTKETTLVGGDKRLAAAYSTVTPDAVMYLNSTSGLPSSGNVIIPYGVPLAAVLPGATSNTAEIAYTGISGNTLTGCSIVSSSPAGSMKWDVNTPVFNSATIYVADTSLFSSSGNIQIGNEVISYSSKGSTYFNLVDGVTTFPNRFQYISTTTSASVAATDTSIQVASTSGFSSSGTIYIETEEIYYSSINSTHFLGCQRSHNAVAHGSSIAVIQVYRTELHPSGVLVKQYTNNAIDSTNGSIKVNGLYSIAIQEPNLIEKEQIESYASRLLQNNRWGGIYHELYPQDVGADFDLLYIGDHVTITDASLGLSASDARVMAMTLTLDRTSAYQFNLQTMPYAYAFYAINPVISVRDYLSMQRNNRWL